MQFGKKTAFVVWSVIGGILTGGAIVSTSLAQTAAPPIVMPQAPMPDVIYPDCQPPSTTEYLLLVATSTPASMETVQRAFPPETAVSVCTYQNALVTRVGGFTNADAAASWVRYLRDTKSLTAYVVRPPGATLPSPGNSSPPSPTSGSSPQPIAANSGYNPQPLGNGYAVLVDFQNRPELAVELQRATGRAVGLVSYRQRPYLLAIYSADQAAVNTVLQGLSDRGLWSMVVDGRKVILLRQTVDLSTLNR